MPINTVQGFQTLFGLGVQHASNKATRMFETSACSIDKQTSLITTDGMIGKRSPVGDSTQNGTYTVGGTVGLWPRADDLDFLLPYILGAVEGTSADADKFALADQLPELVATHDREIIVNTYRGLKVNVATFRSAAGQDLSLELDLQGKTADADGAAGSFPDLLSTLSEKLPYIHQQSTITVDDTEIDVDNVVIVINNALELEHFNNSQTRTVIPEGKRIVTFAFDTELSDDVLDHLIENAARGVTGSAVYSNGVDTLTFTFGLLQKARTPIPVQGVTSIRPAHQFTSYEDLANAVPQLLVTSTNAV